MNISGTKDDFYTLKISSQAGMDDWAKGEYASSYAVSHVEIGKDVISIPDNAFDGYNSQQFRSLTFEEGSRLKTIGNFAFHDPDYLEVSSLPDSVESIGDAAFKDTKFSAQLPKSLTHIGGLAFENCKELKSVTIPQGVTEVNGFQGCVNLAEVNMHDGVTKVSAFAFNGCTSLKSIDLGSVISMSGGDCFKGCASLESVTLNGEMTYLGPNVFNGCTSLSSIKVEGDGVPSRQLDASAFASISQTGTVQIATCAGLSNWQDKVMPLLPEGWTLSYLAHGYGEWITTVKPTCTEAGLQERTCMCGEKSETQPIGPDPDAHKWDDEYTLDAAPGCTDKGSESIHCTLCSAVKDARPVAALGHSFTKYESNDDATCTEDGTETAVCTREGCTATDTRKDVGSALGHEPAGVWSHDGSSHWRACVNGCGKRLEEGAHAFEWVIDRESTATSSGSKHEECPTCGYAKAAVEIPATDEGGPADKPIPGNPSGKPEEPGNNAHSERPNLPATGDPATALDIVAMLGTTAIAAGAALARRMRV